MQIWSSKWELKESAWNEYDPSFHFQHISTWAHKHATERRPKQKVDAPCLPYAPRPLPAHNNISNIILPSMTSHPYHTTLHTLHVRRNEVGIGMFLRISLILTLFLDACLLFSSDCPAKSASPAGPPNLIFHDPPTKKLDKTMAMMSLLPNYH